MCRFPEEFAIIDHTREMFIQAVVEHENQQQSIVGIGQYGIDETSHVADVGVVVRDDMHDHGIGTELLSYITMLAKPQGLPGFTAEVLVENGPMMHLFEQGGFDLELKLIFRENS